MTKFEQVGVNNLMNANSKAEAHANFAWSCNCCCSKGMHINCDKCAIAVNYHMVIAYFAEEEAKCTKK